jgi:hypothetical protein
MVAQPIEKPTGAFVLSLIGGILGLIIGIGLLILGVVSAGVLGYGGYYGYTAALMLFAGLGIWGIITATIVIACAVKLNSHPLEHTKWSTIILVFSIIGLGTLGLIGGIWGLVWKPHTVETMAGPAPPQPITRICTKCGRVIDENLKYCPHCGQELS